MNIGLYIYPDIQPGMNGDKRILNLVNTILSISKSVTLCLRGQIFILWSEALS